MNIHAHHEGRRTQDTTDPGVTVIDEITRSAVADWIDRHYKPDRLNRTPGCRERIITDRFNDMHRHGATLISRHDSVTGNAVRLTTTPRV